MLARGTPEVCTDMPQLYIFVLTALIAAFASGAGVWKVQDWRWTSKTQSEEIVRQKAVLDAEQENRRIESKRQSNVIEAQNAATKREANLRSDLAAATRAGDGLRDTLYSFRSTKLPSAAPDACRRYAAALAELLEDVEREGREAATEAQGHAIDSLKFQESWPKK